MSDPGGKRFAAPALLIWSARDLLRHPQEAILLGSALFLLAAWVGTVLLLVQGVEATALTLLREGPSMVVRRIEACGWVPMPEEEGLARCRSVRGVVRAWPRVWGVAAGPWGPITVVGLDEPQREELRRSLGSVLPAPGEVVLGPGVAPAARADSILLQGAVSLRFRVKAVLAKDTGMALHDVVLVGMEDARSVLGIPGGFASDLAVEVFHEREEEAILPDLAGVFPWPVRITTRSETLGNYAAGLGRKGGIAILLAAPAVLALAYLVGGTIRETSSRRLEIGLLKALGWTTGDVVGLHLCRAIAVGFPAIAAGLCVGYGLVFWPGVRWPGSLLLGWPDRGPPLSLDPSGAFLVLVEVGALVLVPWLAAAILPALKAATADPQELIRTGEVLT